MLGDEIGTIHSRTELTELLKIHVEHGALDVETGREVAGAMNYKELSVHEVMTPVKDCFMLSVSEKLNFKVGLLLLFSCVVFLRPHKKYTSYICLCYTLYCHRLAFVWFGRRVGADDGFQ